MPWLDVLSDAFPPPREDEPASFLIAAALRITSRPRQRARDVRSTESAALEDASEHLVVEARRGTIEYREHRLVEARYDNGQFSAVAPLQLLDQLTELLHLSFKADRPRSAGVEEKGDRPHSCWRGWK